MKIFPVIKELYDLGLKEYLVDLRVIEEEIKYKVLQNLVNFKSNVNKFEEIKMSEAEYLGALVHIKDFKKFAVTE